MLNARAASVKLSMTQPNAVNDLESRMQNEIAVIELDQQTELGPPHVNWKC